MTCQEKTQTTHDSDPLPIGAIIRTSDGGKDGCGGGAIAIPYPSGCPLQLPPVAYYCCHRQISSNPLPIGVVISTTTLCRQHSRIASSQYGNPLLIGATFRTDIQGILPDGRGRLAIPSQSGPSFGESGWRRSELGRHHRVAIPSPSGQSFPLKSSATSTFTCSVTGSNPLPIGAIIRRRCIDCGDSSTPGEWQSPLNRGDHSKVRDRMQQ